MDLLSIVPQLNLYNELWPVKTAPNFSPPVKFSFRQSLVDNAIISGGSIITQAEISNSVLGKRVRVEKGASVRECVFFSGVTIGEGARIWRTIIDKKVKVPPYAQIGFSTELDETRGFKVSDGITVVPKGYVFDSRTIGKSIRILPFLWIFPLISTLQAVIPTKVPTVL